jgi:FK506-binding nuclear protein
VFFKVSGTHAIHLTGNYVIPDDHGHNSHHEAYDSDDEEDEDYDLSPDEDELELEMEDDESDDLDALEDPRITEVDSEEEVPKLVTKAEKKEAKAEKKGKNKRAAEELDDGETLDDLIAKSAKPAEATTNGETKLSKKQLKKMKNNSGEAITTKTEEAKKTEPVKDSAAAKPDKKVQFAKNLEQGPTGSSDSKVKEETKTDSKDSKPKATLGVKTIKGVKIDDKKLGDGPACKKGDRVGMRYIGKLTDGKVFDCKTYTLSPSITF